MKFTCPHCDKVYQGKEENAGRRIKCKGCGEPFTIEPDDAEVSFEEEEAVATDAIGVGGEGGEESEESEDSPWATIGYGVLLIAVGVGLFLFFNHKEAEGGGFRMNAIVLLVYNMLGKYGVLGIFGGLGGLLLVMGIRDVAKPK